MRLHACTVQDDEELRKMLMVTGSNQVDGIQVRTLHVPCLLSVLITSLSVLIISLLPGKVIERAARASRRERLCGSVYVQPPVAPQANMTSAPVESVASTCLNQVLGIEANRLTHPLFTDQGGLVLGRGRRTSR